MKKVIFIFSIIFLNSCIPYSIAPNIEDYKVVKGKRFKRSLPRQNAFVFKDPKKAEEFYLFVDAKFDLDIEQLERYITFNINEKEYVFSFKEVERTTKTVNFVPMIIDAKLESNGVDPLLEDAYTSRSGHWYIAISITNENNTDCLNPKYTNQKEVINYLKALKNEYLMTHNYTELLLKK